MPKDIVKTQIRPLLKNQSGQLLHCLLRQGKVGKIRFVKGRLEVANSANPDQTALKVSLICIYNICHLNTTFLTLLVPEQIVNKDMTAPEGKYDLCFY